MLPKDVASDANFLQEWNSHRMLVRMRRREALQSTAGLTCGSESRAGSLKLVCSGLPAMVETSRGASRASTSITSSTSFSGADAPAVMPTTRASRTQLGSTSQFVSRAGNFCTRPYESGKRVKEAGTPLEGG